jgi:hypothetical protein
MKSKIIKIENVDHKTQYEIMNNIVFKKSFLLLSDFNSFLNNLFEDRVANLFYKVNIHDLVKILFKENNTKNAMTGNKVWLFKYNDELIYFNERKSLFYIVIPHTQVDNQKKYANISQLFLIDFFQLLINNNVLNTDNIEGLTMLHEFRKTDFFKSLIIKNKVNKF